MSQSQKQNFHINKFHNIQLCLNNKEQINVTFLSEGINCTSTGVNLQTHLPACFGKKYITYLSWLFLTSLRFYELVRENLQLYGWVFALLLYIYSAYVSERRCHKQAFPSK